MNQIVEDPKAHRKVLLLYTLTRLALSSGIALIFVWERMRDPMRGKWEQQYQSFGFPEAFRTCIYCGRSQLSAKDKKQFGQSRAHLECRIDAHVNWEEPTYLPPNKNRPPVIFFRGNCPGSIDNAIMRVAWGIGMHHWLSKLPSAPVKSLDSDAKSYGMALVSRFMKEEEDMRS